MSGRSLQCLYARFITHSSPFYIIECVLVCFRQDKASCVGSGIRDFGPSLPHTVGFLFCCSRTSKYKHFSTGGSVFLSWGLPYRAAWLKAKQWPNKYASVSLSFLSLLFILFTHRKNISVCGFKQLDSYERNTHQRNSLYPSKTFRPALNAPITWCWLIWCDRCIWYVELLFSIVVELCQISRLSYEF